jgi:putative peptide zinc metalloprotease protein
MGALMQRFSRGVTVVLNQITYQEEGSDVIVGRVDTGVFVAIPAEAREILDLLSQGMSIGQVSDFYQEKYGEIPDLEEFLTLLEGKGLISQAGEKPGTAAVVTAKTRKLNYHFSNFPQSVAKVLFGKAAIIAYGALILAAIVETIANPSIRPRVSSLYFPSDRALTWGLVVIATYLSLFLHELAHLIAARAHGINSRLGIGHRLWFLVAETDLTGLWSIPRNERYLPFLAGMICDAVLCAAIVFVLVTEARGALVMSALLLRFFQALFFTLVMRLVWQFLLYIRTDVYYVIANALRCRNLLGDTEVFLRNQVARIFPSVRAVSQQGIPKQELQIIRIYSIIWTVGRISAFTLLFTVTIPVALHYARDLRDVFIAGYSSSPSNFIDSFVLSMCFFVPLTIGAALWIQDLIRRGRTLSWPSQ